MAIKRNYRDENNASDSQQLKQILTPMCQVLHVNPEDQKPCSAGMETVSVSWRLHCCQQQTKNPSATVTKFYVLLTGICV